MFFPHRIIKRGQQSGVLRIVVGLDSQVIRQLGDDLTLGIADHNAISRGAGIAAGAAIDVGLDRGGAVARWLRAAIEERLLGQRPSSSRMASRSGSPAEKIFSCARSML